MSDASAKVLEQIGGFNVISRGIVHLPKVRQNLEISKKFYLTWELNKKCGAHGISKM